MKKHILTLIQNDIINTKLVSSFNDVGIDLSNYALNIDNLILKKIGIKKYARTEALYEKYYELVKKGKKINVNDKEEIEKLSVKIYRFLLRHV